jgi:hypothetical protein
MPMTLIFCASSFSEVFHPIKPAQPVTTIVFIYDPYSPSLRGKGIVIIHA